ncbi:hypothetical protein AGMMS50212_07580 [Spirochaetia bacterium]|nr:hypothetical protein AGMMS50212_07580 [Spirochaetia bacterium]
MLETDDELYLFDFDEIDNLKKTNSVYNLPVPPKTDAKWILPGETVTVGKYEINSGFFYLGTHLPSRYVENEPSLIDPSLPLPRKFKELAVSRHDPAELVYAKLTDSERRSYIAWLAGGRNSADVSNWVLKLFLYGLERRVIDDGKRGIVKAEENIAIRNEVERILFIYAEKKLPALGAYSLFFQYIELKIHDRRLWKIPVPPCIENKDDNDVPVYLKVAFSQCATDGKRLPAEFAFAYLAILFSNSKHNVMQWCPNEFKKVFDYVYKNTLGEGLKLKNSYEKIKGKHSYYPQTPAVGYIVPFYIPPDASEMEFNIETKITKIYSDAFRILERYISWKRNFVKGDALSYGNLLRPSFLWDEKTTTTFNKMKHDMEKRILPVIEAVRLIQILAPDVAFSKKSLVDLAVTFEREGIFIEPDILVYPYTINAEDRIVLHKLKTQVPVQRNTNSYQAGILLAQLMAAVVCECIPQYLDKRFSFPVKLNEYFLERLDYYYSFLLHNPLPLSKVILRFKKFSKNDKQGIILFIQKLLPGENKTEYKTISVLEKIYKGFGFSNDELYTTLHNDNTADKQSTSEDFKLDQKKINKLRKDSEKASKVLAGIFTEAEEITVQQPSLLKQNKNHLGLDESHFTFVNSLMDKDLWNRAEIEKLSKQHGLMPDGAIETINEAFFNEYDEPFIETGDDVEYNINVEIVKRYRENSAK